MGHFIAEPCVAQQPVTGNSTWEFLAQMLSGVLKQGDLKQHVFRIAEKHLNQPQDRFSLDFLPLFTATVVQGNIDRLPPVVAAWQLVRLSAKLFDDVEDGDVGDQSASYTNLATSCLFAAQLALDKLPEYDYSTQQVQQIRSRFNLACIKACEGQHTDIALVSNHKILDPDQWFGMTQAKSGYLFAWASWAGVLAVGGSKKVQTSFWDFGMQLGELIQIADDFNDLWNTLEEIRLSAFFSSLPFCYAYYEADPNEKNELIKCFSQSGKENAARVAELRKMISDLGGQKFVLAAAWVKQQEALRSLEGLWPSDDKNEEITTFVTRIFPAINSLTTSSYD